MQKRVIIVLTPDELAHMLSHVEHPLSCPLTAGMVQLLGQVTETDDQWSILTTPGPVPFDYQYVPGIGQVIVSPQQGGDHQ